MPENISKYFESYLKSGSLFKNKKAIQSTYMPEEVKHREEQIEATAQIIAPALRGERPSNLFIYGKTGTGKTLTIRHTVARLLHVAEQEGIPLHVYYVNCKMKKVSDTEYRLIAELARLLGKAVPPTGLPTEEVYKSFQDAIEKTKSVVVLVLDEIDQLVKKVGDEVIYNLTRMNTELHQSQVSLIGISNDVTFSMHLDPRVKSSLSEEEILFPPYNAFQIQTILQRRANLAFTPDALAEGVVAKCAAHSARDHGDARRALELLRVAGELAERENEKQVGIAHVDNAVEKVERDKYLEIVKYQPRQSQAVLLSLLSFKANVSFSTGEVYSLYTKCCVESGLRPLTNRRVSDIIAEFDLAGFISADVISKGRFGRMRQIQITLPTDIIPKIKDIITTELGI